MTPRKYTPALHTVIIVAAACFYTLYIYLTGQVTATSGDMLWHYTLGAAGLWCLYASVYHLTGSRQAALGAAVVWAISPATMGVNALATEQGPMMTLTAVCIYAIIQIKHCKPHPALTMILGSVMGVGLSIGAYCLADQPQLWNDLHAGLKEAIITLLYERTGERPGWVGDVPGGYLSVPWLIIAWIYVAYLWRLTSLWHSNRPKAGVAGGLWIMGVLGAPYALIGVAFVLAADMLSRPANTRSSVFASPKALWVCMAIIVAWSIALALTEGPLWCGDTQSYYTASYYLASGEIDTYRTPLYPLLLSALTQLFGAGAEWCLVWLQFLGLWVSAVMLYRMLRLIWGGTQAAFWVTLLYGISAPTASICLVIATESLAITLLVGCAYAMTVMWKRGYTLRHMALLAVSLAAVVALRPAMMYMIVAVAIYGVAALCKHRKATAIGAGCTVIATTVMVLAYCTAMYHRMGLFTPTLVGTVNRYADMAYANPNLDSVTTTHPAVLSDIKATGYDSTGKLFVWTGAMYMERHGAEAVASFLSDVEADYGSLINTEKARRLAAQYDMRPMMVKNSLMTYMSAALLTVPFSVVIIVMVLWPFIAMVRCRKIRILPTLLYICVAGNLAAVIIGAPDATARLLLPSSPLLLFLGADLLMSCVPSALKCTEGLADSGKMRKFAE